MCVIALWATGFMTLTLTMTGNQCLFVLLSTHLHMSEINQCKALLGFNFVNKGCDNHLPNCIYPNIIHSCYLS